MWSNDKNFHSRGFSTPQPTWKSRRQADYPARPHSEGKRMSPGDLFHVIHKVPPGDSPYVRAKHIQLIEKDPSRAISLFWAAINAGDRVDSALKDMAVVMKQLDRSDEAIEAIKSFRHLCPCDSQESIDNLLVELYKRSGRVEEEIEMLQCKLKNIEEGLAFGGKRTKIARSQGKKIQITMEQERSRILGNLAWAYLQQNKYENAEQHYRKALSLEPDKNKQCNLAICLMKMNRMAEARSLLQAVRASCRNREMDESYAKSYERAFQMLTALESHSLTPVSRNLKEVTSSIIGGQDHVLYTQPRPWRNSVQLKDKAAVQFFSQPIVNENWKKLCSRSNGFDEPVMKSDSVHPPGTGNSKKSWADMAEEEERELLSFAVWNNEEEFNDENMNSNINCWPQNQVETLSQKLGSFDIKDGCGNAAVSSRNASVRRSLCFDQSQKPVKERYSVSGNLKRGKRLQVFRDITPFPDSP